MSSTIEFRHILNRIPEYHHFEEQLLIGPHHSRHRIIDSGDPEVLVDQVSDLSSSKESVFFMSFHFLQTDLFLEAGILNDFVQC